MQSDKTKKPLNEQRKPENASGEAELLYRTLFNQSPDGILLIDTNGNFIEFNDAACLQLGYSREEFGRLRLTDVDPFQGPTEIRASIQKVIDDGSAEFDVKHRMKSGDMRDVHVITQLTNLSGRTVFHTIWRDTTEHKKAEENLKLFSRAVEEATDGIHLVDLNGRIFYANKANERIYGYSAEELMKLHVSVLNADKEFDATVVIPSIRGTGRWDGELEVIHKDGHRFPIWLSAALIKDDRGGPLAMLGIIRDITKRKKSEESLKELNARLETLVRAIPDMVFFKDLEGKYLIANKAVEEFTGLSQQALIGRTDADLLPPDLLEDCAKSDKEVLQRRRPIHVEERSKGEDGEYLYFDTVKAPIFDELGELAGLVAISRDVTERKKSEEALRTNREFIKSILDTVDEGFIVIDKDYRIVLSNNAYLAQQNMPVESVVGKHCYEISHQSDAPCYEKGEECAARETFETGNPHVCVHKHHDKDGSMIYVETKSYPLRDAAGTITSVIEIINNITDKYLLEEQILRTQKLEALGLLAGGVAHDFNNLLQGVFGYMSLAMMHSGKDSAAYKMLEEAERALTLSRDLTRQLLTFSKGGEPVKKVITLVRVVQDSVRFALSGSVVDYRFSVEDDLWTVEADEGQISQVIQNIVLNASDAMPEGGSVRISLKNVVVDGKGGPPLGKGNYVMIAIEDSGIGIPEQHISKIFDPYFTTKQKGSGLGLATSYSIIKKHNGVLTVTSELGVGSVFSVYLPASVQKLSPDKAEEKGLYTGKGKILVMDDEEIIQTVVGHMLNALGYDVSVVANGEQAEELFVRALNSGKPFDAVILDLTIRGGAGGKETIKKLREIYPAVTAIVSSGYSDDPIVANYRDFGFKATISKPFEIEELSRILHELVK